MNSVRLLSINSACICLKFPHPLHSWCCFLLALYGILKCNYCRHLSHSLSLSIYLSVSHSLYHTHSFLFLSNYFSLSVNLSLTLWDYFSLTPPYSDFQFPDISLRISLSLSHSLSASLSYNDKGHVECRALSSLKGLCLFWCRCLCLIMSDLIIVRKRSRERVAERKRNA